MNSSPDAGLLTTADALGATPARIDGIERIVLVAPHPDDEVLSCGLLLAVAAERGVAVQVIAATDGEAAYPGQDPVDLARQRRGEQLAALAEVGVEPDRVDRCGLPDGHVADHVDTLASTIVRHLSTPAGTLLVAPTIHDWHPDHEACGRAARHAIDQMSASGRPAHWSSLFWAHHHPDRLLASRPRLLRLDGTPAQASARARAISCHRSQFTSAGHDEPVLDAALVAHLDIPLELYVQEHP